MAGVGLSPPSGFGASGRVDGRDDGGVYRHGNVQRSPPYSSQSSCVEWTPSIGRTIVF
jgi:hypothetical protein